MNMKNLPEIKMVHSGYPGSTRVWAKVRHLRSYLCGLAAILLPLLLAATSHSEEIPWSGNNFFHISEDQPVESLLKDILLSERILANISTSIADTPVSGKFDKPAEQIFRQITSAFNLIWYYDGQVVYICPANEMESKNIALKHTSIKKVKRSLREMGITDRKYPLRYYGKERLVMVHGPGIYVKRISDALKTIDVYQAKPAQKAPDGQAVESSAVRREPVKQNVRIFRLKHAWAADRMLKIGDRTVTIEGVASILRGLTNKKQNKWLSFGSLPGDDHVGARVAKVKETSDEDRKLKEEGRKEQPLSEVEYQPESRHTIQCAERLNAVIINADPVNMAYYEKMIAELDVPLQLIEIKASIIDVDSEALSAIGLDLEGSEKRHDAAYTYHSNVIPDDNPLFGLTKIPTGGFGGLGFSAILGDLADDYFALRLKALESKGDAKVVSKPSIITFDNIEARFTNTETFYVRVAAQEDASLYEISAGLILKVTPHLIFEEHNPRIQLLISIEDGKINPSEVDEIPVVGNSTINTQAVVSGNESLLIGGLIYDTHREIQRKIPLLGDIPLLGNLFRSKDKINTKTERLFLISPRIVSVDGKADVIAQESSKIGRRRGSAYRNWPPIKLFETTF
jgi:type III secretion protein C